MWFLFLSRPCTETKRNFRIFHKWQHLKHVGGPGSSTHMKVLFIVQQPLFTEWRYLAWPKSYWPVKINCRTTSLWKYIGRICPKFHGFCPYFSVFWPLRLKELLKFLHSYTCHHLFYWNLLASTISRGFWASMVNRNDIDQKHQFLDKVLLYIPIRNLSDVENSMTFWPSEISFFCKKQLLSDKKYFHGPNMQKWPQAPPLALISYS